MGGAILLPFLADRRIAMDLFAVIINLIFAIIDLIFFFV